MLLFAWLGLLVLALAGAFSPVRLVSRRGICRLVPRLAAEDGGGLTGGGVAVFDLAVGNDLSPLSVDEWLGAVDLTAGSYRMLRDRDALLSAD